MKSLKSTFGALAAGLVLTSGCGYIPVHKTELEKTMKAITFAEKENCARYLQLGQMIRSNQYEQAQACITAYLKEERNSLSNTERTILKTPFSEELKEETGKTIQQMVTEINNYLEDKPKQ